MCTLTVIADKSTTRVIMNRDEQRSRATALSPCERAIGAARVVMPIDPTSGGTWIAATSTGLIFAVLNRNTQHSTRRSFARSRGSIIAELADAANVDDATNAAQRLVTSEFLPFRIIVVGTVTVAEIVADAAVQSLATHVHSLVEPLLFTSSGLGDQVVEAPRRELFDRIFDSPAQHWAAAQREFHAHRWPERLAQSVHMARDEARTVSRTTIVRTPRSIEMSYEPEDENVFGVASVIGLPRMSTEPHEITP
ncbi:MAG: NRDE family protein [Phycisphaerae bacterium]|mgnify:CR=1 FL=1|nr:NRDE family protein [Phycisphaerae bacterium]